MHNTTSRLRLLYGGAITMAILLALSGYVMLTSLHGVVADDGAVINAAGRQRMLSQRIAQLSLRLHHAYSDDAGDSATLLRQDLRAILDHWVAVHGELLAGATHEANSGQRNGIHDDLETLSPVISRIDTAARGLINFDPGRANAAAEAQAALDHIVSATEAYLPLMDAVVSRYEHALRQHGQRFDQAALIELAVTVLMLVAGMVLVLEPNLRRTHAQREELSRLRNMLDEHAMYAVIGADGRIVDVNRQFCEVHARKADDLVGIDAGEIGVAGDASWTNAVREAMRYGRPWRGETRIPVDGGESGWAETTILPYRDADGAPSRYVSLQFNITERRRAEDAARIAHQHLDSILNAATQVAIIATDRDGTIVSFNNGAERMLGYSASEIVGKATPALIHLEAELAERCSELTQELGRPVGGIEVFTTVADTGGFEERQWTYVRKDGSRLLVNITVTATRGADGLINGYLGVAQDVTAAVEHDTALREIKAALDASDDAVFIMEADSLALNYANAGTERMLGYSFDALRALPPTELNPEFSREALLHRCLPLNDGTQDRLVFRTSFTHRDRRVIPVEVQIQLVRDLGPHGRYFAVARDITTLLEQERKLDYRQQELRMIIDAIPGLVYYKDDNNRILDCNAAAARTIGLPREDIIGHLTQDLFPPEDAAAYHRDDLAVLMSGKPKLGILEQYDTGSTRLHLRTDKIPLQGPSGEFDRLVAVANDITDVVVANEEARTARERLDLALQASNTGLWDWDAVTNETVFNDNWFTMLGYEPGELPSHFDTWISICHPDDLEHVLADVDRHMSGEADQICNEHRLRCKDGSWKWIRDVGRIVSRTEDGEPQRVVGVHVDVQELRDAITVAERSNVDLTETQQRFELAVAGSRDAIFDWNVPAGSVHYSPRWRDLLALGKRLPGDDIDFLVSHVAPEDRGQMAETLRAFAASGDDHINAEVRLMTDDGKVVRGLLRAAAIRSEDGSASRISGSVADITELKIAEDNLRSIVQKDQLTGLASRSRLMDRLHHALALGKRNGTICALLFFDFDRFKVVNDSLGHDVGDQLLCSIARRLTANTREIDTPARLGGDEFVVLLEDLPDTEAALLVADKLLDVCREPHLIGGHKLISTASIGLVTNELVGDDPDVLLRCADTAMYQAKAAGRGRVCCYDQAMHDAQMERLEIEEDLGTAAACGQLALHYQPVVELATGAIISAEALLRWTHPKRGPISPAVFIDIAEESGQIEEIGAWVIETACQQLAHWRRRQLVADSFALSINVSKAQLLTPDFIVRLLAAIDRAGLPRRSLKIEVTETTVVDNRAGVAEVLNELRQLGITVMMDDFGTGHSSLSGLHTLPVDELKIDQSFIRPADSNSDLLAITGSIVSLAQHLNLRTVGEGVESQQHVDLLRELGCTCGQGYYWSRPVPEEAFEALLSDWRAELYGARNAS